MCCYILLLSPNSKHPQALFFVLFGGLRKAANGARHKNDWFPAIKRYSTSKVGLYTSCCIYAFMLIRRDLVELQSNRTYFQIIERKRERYFFVVDTITWYTLKNLENGLKSGCFFLSCFWGSGFYRLFGMKRWSMFVGEAQDDTGLYSGVCWHWIDDWKEWFKKMRLAFFKLRAGNTWLIFTI